VIETSKIERKMMARVNKTKMIREINSLMKTWK